MDNRRDFLSHLGSGLAGIAFAWLSGNRSIAATHHPAKAKRVIQIFCPGAASHIDLWDWKPELERLHDQPLPGPAEVTFQGKNGNLMRSPFDFKPYGQSGKRITSMLPNLGTAVDDIAFIHSMTSRTNTHGPGCVFMNSGFVFEGFPARARGSATRWAARTRTCRHSLRFPICAATRPTARRTGAADSCRRNIRPCRSAPQQPIRNLGPAR